MRLRRLTDEKLREIEQRAEKATPRPWSYIESGNVIVTENADYKHAAEITEELTHGYDADFIAHAREDVPALTTEVRRLREAIRKIDYAIYTQHCTMNAPGNTEYERGQINGLITASNIVKRYVGDAND